tara:strand:+ start:210 stop:680 length:471 start_codon:yes stop_codon:yes gene_type:complete
MEILNIYWWYSIYIIVFIVLSDILDGFLARKFNSVTSFGKIIDPVADKICLMCVLIYLIEVYHLPFLIFFILLSIRDIVLISMTSYLAIYHDMVSQANTYGKLFIFITMIMIIFHVFNLNDYISKILFIVSNILLIISMLTYIKDHIKNINSYEHI